MLNDSEIPNAASGSEIKAFKKWLEYNGTRPKTIEGKVRLLQNYLEWLDDNQITAETINYSQLLDYIGYLQKTGKSKLTINRHLKTAEQSTTRVWTPRS